MSASETIRRADAFWAGYFGCTPEDLSGSKVLVLEHKALAGHEGVLVFRRGNACVVSVPATTPEISRERLRGATSEQAFDPAFLARTFVVWKDRVLPPAWVGICEKGDFKDVPSAARLLTREDEEAVRQLAEGCGEVAWKQSKLALEREHNFGLFEGKTLVAASGYLVMGGVLAYIGVITHPQHRGKGHARKVTSASIRSAYERGLIPMWRTPQANEAAIALASAIGFKPYASTLDVRLVEDEF